MKWGVQFIGLSLGNLEAQSANGDWLYDGSSEHNSLPLMEIKRGISYPLRFPQQYLPLGVVSHSKRNLQPVHQLSSTG